MKNWLPSDKSFHTPWPQSVDNDWNKHHEGTAKQTKTSRSWTSLGWVSCLNGIAWGHVPVGLLAVIGLRNPRQSSELHSSCRVMEIAGGRGRKSPTTEVGHQIPYITSAKIGPNSHLRTVQVSVSMRIHKQAVLSLYNRILLSNGKEQTIYRCL